MRLSYPLKPQNEGFPPLINQGFGGNSEYYKKFLDSFGKPWKGHPGIDFQAAHGTPVYAAHDGYAFYVGPDDHGGDGVYLHFQDEDDDTKWWTCINWHLISINDPKLAPTVDRKGRQVKEGEILGYADNTGAPYESTGDHEHFGLVPTNQAGAFLHPDNGYGGAIDPMPYFKTPITEITDTIAKVDKVAETQPPDIQKSFWEVIQELLKMLVALVK